MNARLGFLLAATLVATACGGVKPLVVLPTDAGTPATDGAQVLQQATAACRAATTLSTEVRLTGRIAGRRARGRLLVGVKAPASAYIDAPAPFGASAFIFAAVDDTSTLLLPRDRRVLEHGRPMDVLEAVTGVALSPADLRETLSGCVGGDDRSAVRQVGDNWRVVDAEPQIFLKREQATAPWRIVAVVHRASGRPEWRAEYASFVDALPTTMRLTSTDRNRFDLQLTLSQIERNVPLEDSVFHPEVPAGYQPISLEQLRDAGPLAESDR